MTVLNADASCLLGSKSGCVGRKLVARVVIGRFVQVPMGRILIDMWSMLYRKMPTFDLGCHLILVGLGSGYCPLLPKGFDC